MIPPGDAVETAALAVLASAAGMRSADLTPVEVVDQVLTAVCASGLCDAVRVELDGVHPLRCAAGDTALLDGDGSSTVATSREKVSVPIALRGARCGQLTALPARPLPPGLLPAVCDHLALAVDRALLGAQVCELNRAAEQRTKEMSAIYEIGREMDRVEIGRLLEIITEKAAHVMEAQACSLMRLSQGTNSLTIAASYGLSEDVVVMTQRALGEGIAGRVAQTGEPMLIVDAARDPRLSGVSLRADIGSSMVVPMRDEQGRVLGVLSIRRRRPAPDFDQESLRLFSVFASQAGLAITNAQLYSDLRHRVSELSTLSDLSQAVISIVDSEALLGVVADRIIGVLGFDRCCIYLLDRTTRRYIPRVLRGYRPEVIGARSVRLGEGVVGIVARKLMPIAENNARSALQPMRGFARALGVNSFVAIPIVAKSQAIGVVVADNKLTGHTVAPDAVELLTTFVEQAALAIENAQLHEDREQRFQEMNRLATQTDNILRSIAAAVVVVDAAGNVTRWNRAAETMWSISEDDAVRLGYADLVARLRLPDDEASRLARQMEEARTTGVSEQIYKLALHPGGRPELWVNVLVSPLIDRIGERQGAVQTMEDITHEIRLEAEMGRMRRLADIGQLAAKLAHEVRNPLSSIKGAAQLLRNEHEQEAPLREFLDIIIDEVNALNRITTELLDFARPMKLDLRLVNLNDLVNRNLRFMASYLAEHSVSASFEPAPDLSDSLGDPKQIEQVMRNVVINAVQAMPNGGDLRIATWNEPDRGHVVVSYSDTGVGIPPARLDDIFHPFVTTKTKGTGLGLPIARKIVENHGGHITVESHAGRGTSFAIAFPIRPTEADLQPPGHPRDAAPVAPTLPDV